MLRPEDNFRPRLRKHTNAVGLTPKAEGDISGMATKLAIGSRRMRSFESFAVILALAALVVLLAQHFTTTHKVLAQNRTPGAHLSGAQDPVLSAQQDSAPDRAAAIIAYDTAVNNGDLDAAMATFASN